MSVKFFLDSGAFSADSQGKPVILDDYIAFIKQHEALLDIYPVLDVIGDYKATWENQRIMEEAGLNPLPVFHVEDPMECLTKCLDYEYFCLGGMAGGASHATRERFLNRCFDIICGSPDRMPRSKVHGFGLASPSLMTAYPFYSVDTSSWVAYSQYGIALMPRIDANKQPRYEKTPIKLFVSTRSTKTEIEGLHISNMSPVEREIALMYINELGFELGESEFFDVESDYQLQDNEVYASRDKSAVERILRAGISNNNSLRYAYNLAYFDAIAKSCPEWPWPWRPKIKSFF